MIDQDLYLYQFVCRIKHTSQDFREIRSHTKSDTLPVLRNGAYTFENNTQHWCTVDFVPHKVKIGLLSAIEPCIPRAQSCPDDYNHVMGCTVNTPFPILVGSPVTFLLQHATQ